MRTIRSSPTNYMMRALIELERIAYFLKLPSFLHISRFFISHVAWPHVILENPDVEIVMMVPPTEPFITHWNRNLLQMGVVPKPERVRPWRRRR